MSIKTLALAATCSLALSGAALAQATAPSGTTGTGMGTSGTSGSTSGQPKELATPGGANAGGGTGSTPTTAPGANGMSTGTVAPGAGTSGTTGSSTGGSGAR